MALTVTTGVVLVVAGGAPADAAGEPRNAGFESGGGLAQAVGWTDDGFEDAAFTERGGHSGGYRLSHWSSQPYRVETYQQLTGLRDGTFRLSVWTKSSGGQRGTYIALRDCGGTEARTPVPTGDAWKQVSVTAEVTSGRCTLSLVSDAAANNWTNFDDVRFARVSGGRGPAAESSRPSTAPTTEPTAATPSAEPSATATTGPDVVGPTPGAEPSAESSAPAIAEPGVPASAGRGWGIPIVAAAVAVAVCLVGVAGFWWRRRTLGSDRHRRP